MVGHSHGGISHPLEVMETVLEVADVAWTAMEVRHRHHKHSENHAAAKPAEEHNYASSEEELESLRCENRRLRTLLEQNLKLLQQLAQSPSLSDDCPSDLYERLKDTVDSKVFLTQLESLHQASMSTTTNSFPFKEATGADMHSLEIMVNVDSGEPSWWVWVRDDMVPSSVEEWSGIDNENYLIVNEEHVADAVAYFMARCILSNPKAKGLTPEELQKIVGKALGGMSKMEKMMSVWHAGQMFYVLSTWGLALAGLYTNRAILRAAAKGVHSSSKIVLRAL